MDEPKTNETQKTEEAKNACAQCGEYLAGWKRAQADYANLKRETEKEKIEFSKFANERLLIDLLPVFDQLEKAIGHAPDASSLPEAERTKIEGWIRGINLIHSLWEKKLSEIGLELLDDTTFDPYLHEAVGYETSSHTPEGDIVRTIERGWKYKDKLLRPAKVIVSKR